VIWEQILPQGDGLNTDYWVAPHVATDQREWNALNACGTVRSEAEERGATTMAASNDRRRPKREGGALFEAEAAYADCIIRSAIGDTERCIRALERAVEINPGYAPAVLALGSVEYQRKRKAKRRRLLLSLVSMVDDAPDRTETIDAAGVFLIQSREYSDGFEPYRTAVQRFPDASAFHQGTGCCAGHMGEFQEAVAASRHALELEPDNQQLVHDLGWSLTESGSLQEALATRERAPSSSRPSLWKAAWLSGLAARTNARTARA
jgi:tetratricopeptide (TPR) repeat protein